MYSLAVDIYSLGVILFYVLSGRLPFTKRDLCNRMIPLFVSMRCHGVLFVCTMVGECVCVYVCVGVVGSVQELCSGIK